MMGLLVLLALAIPACAIAGLLVALSVRSRVVALHARIDVLEAELRRVRTAARPAAAEEPVRQEAFEPEPEPAPAPAPSEAAPAKAPVPAIQAPSPQPAPHGQDIEARLGSRWAVWIGGVALALGGIFLVRYSIEQNLLTPETRIALGGLFALALIGAGEWLRRRDVAFDLPGIPDANVPSVLTAAGTCAAFASAYAAHALYGLIGPATAFVLLGLIAVLAMVASALHGPGLAALGLMGAMGSPLLVSSESPQPWALVVYLVFVALPAYGVARFRLWRWLALAAAIGTLAWSLPIFLADTATALPLMIHLAVQTALAAFFLAAEPYRHVPDEEAGTDWAAGAVLLLFALNAIVAASLVEAGGGRSVFVAAAASILAAAGLRAAPVASAAASAALVAVGALLVWPIRRELGADPENLFYQSGDAFATRPQALGTYLTLAILLPLSLAGAALLRLSRSPGLRLPAAAWYAGTATAGPLLALVVSYWRVAQFERSLSFALAAGLLALIFIGAVNWLVRRQGEAAPLRLGLGAGASAALAALALGLTFALDKGMLTVAFALTALDTAWVAERVAIPALRHAVGAIGLIVLGRLVWDPTIVGGNPGPILVNWLLWGYGVPAIAFFLASRLLERSGRDRIVQLAESLSIVFTAFLIFFQIRHALHAGDPLARDFGLLEAGLLATESLAFSVLLTRLNLRRADPVYRWGSLIFKILSFGLAAIGLLVTENPLLTDEAIAGGVVFNTLILAYLLPSLLAALLARAEWHTQPRAYAVASAILSLVLQWAYIAFAIRRIFQGPNLGIFWRGFSQGEQWSYSVALLAIGIALLGYGLVRNSRFARLASAVYLVLAVVKVFIVDLANLEGVMRALSFIGLGLVLIGIGLVYQRLLAQRPSNAAIS